MTHEEFLLNYRVGEGNTCRYNVEGTLVAKNFLKKVLSASGLDVESWYLKCRGIEVPRCECGGLCKFIKLRDGYSNSCSLKCATKKSAIQQ